MEKIKQLESKLIESVPISKTYMPLGRGNIRFPEWLNLNVSKDGTTGDCLVYADTPYNRKCLLMAKNNYNKRSGAFKGRRFTHRYEIRHGEPVMIIQRII